MVYNFKRICLENVSDEQLERMVQIEDECGLDIKFSKTDLAYHLAVLNCYACFDGKRLVGYIMFDNDVILSNDCYIYNYEIDKRYQKRGIGCRLLYDAYIDLIKYDKNTKYITLDVQEGNNIIGYYKKLGFKKLSNYKDNKNLISMKVDKNIFETNINKEKLKLLIRIK